MDSLFLQLILDGLANGAIYAALALAIVLVARRRHAADPTPRSA